MRAQVSCGLHTAVASTKELVPYLQSISGTLKFILTPLITLLLGQTRETDFFLPLSFCSFYLSLCTKYSCFYSSPLLIGHFVHNQYLHPQLLSNNTSHWGLID